jgi:hypothetical protein
MTLIAKSKGRSYPAIEGGSYHAICYSVVDLGVHYNQRWDKKAHKVMITWELPELRIDIERENNVVNLPRAISKEYTLSIHEKSNLGRDLTCWRGVAFTPDERDGFDIQSIIKANCILQIINTEKDGEVYANVQAVTKLLKGMEKKEPENPLCLYSMAQDGFTFPEHMPDWLKDKIKQSEEYQAWDKNKDNEDLARAHAAAGMDEDQRRVEEDEDEIPF